MSKNTISNLGISNLGSLSIKRKFRWTFEASFPAGDIPRIFVRLNKRPSITIAYPPLPPMVDEIEMTLYDSTDKELEPMWKVMGDLYNLAEEHNGFIPAESPLAEKWLAQTGTGKFCLWDGTGQLLEEWHVTELFPLSINFSDLDFSSSSIPEVIILWRFKCVEYKTEWPTSDTSHVPPSIVIKTSDIPSVINVPMPEVPDLSIIPTFISVPTTIDWPPICMGVTPPHLGSTQL